MEIQPADPRLRLTAGLVCLAGALAGAAALVALQRWLSGLSQAGTSSAAAQALAAFTGLVGTACVSLLALAVYFWRTAARIRRAGQFPPPGMRVVRDTPVRRGAAAVRRGRILQGISVALVLSGAALAVATWYLHLVLFKGAL